MMGIAVMGWTPPDGIDVPKWSVKLPLEGGVHERDYYDWSGSGKAGFSGARRGCERRCVAEEAPDTGESVPSEAPPPWRRSREWTSLGVIIYLGDIMMMVRYLSNDGQEVGLRIHYPQEGEAEYKEFSCRFETFGLKENISGNALGVDAIDAMLNAMMRVDIFLKSSEEFKDGNIRWVGGIAPDDFGLPWQSAKRY